MLNFMSSSDAGNVHLKAQLKVLYVPHMGQADNEKG